MSDRWLRYLDFWRRDPKRDVDDEIEFHLEARVADLVARGLAADAARRQAANEFGDAEAIRAATLRIDARIARRGRRADWIGEIARDARVGLRSLLRTPGYTATTVLCAALGIGVTGAVVSAAYSILVRPLPYPGADRLVAVYSENPIRDYHGVNISWPDYESWRTDTRAFAALGMWTWSTATLSSDTDAERVSGAEVTANLFPTLGVQPALGRGFSTEEQQSGHNFVALLSHRLWQRRFGGSKSIVGAGITLDGRSYTVVGVMPPGFNFPDNGDLWTPFSTNPAGEARGNRGYAGAIGRLKPAVSIDQARSDLHRIDANLVRQFPDENDGWRAELIPLRDDLVGDLRRPLEVFLAAVAMVLLIVCANIANLMLARGAARWRELAIRTALGASRGRVVRQLLTESVLTAAIGGVIGLGIAWFGIRLLRFGFPDQVTPYYIRLGLDGPAVAFVALITLLSGILFGTVPALRGSRVDLNTSLREGARQSAGGLHGSRVRALLVVGEIALSVILMVGAVLLARSYRNLEGTDLGFDERHVVSARITLGNADYPTRASTAAFYQRVLDDLRRLPGVEAVGAAQGIPFSGWNVQSAVTIEGEPPPKRGQELDAHFQFVTPDYFKAIGVPLLRGRWLTDADRDTLNPVVLVNEKMVERAFGGQDPIGRRLHIGGPKEPFATVVGVIRDFRHYRLPRPMGPAFYFPFAVYPARQQSIVMRTIGDDPRSLVPELRAAVRAIDRRVAVSSVETLGETVSRSLWRQRLQGSVVTIFAALAFALACLGLYGVIAYAVAQRTRELGVRIALGATGRNVLLLVGRQSVRLVATGIALGLAGAYFGVRVLESLLYGISPTDLETFALVPAVLAIVALVAAVIPAARATRVDPIIAMRSE
jgi:putative ABC transport system permease protein